VKKSLSRLWLLLSSLAALALPAYGQQIVEVEDNGAYQVKLSARELTRIVVDSGRIRRIDGNEGEFVIQRDAKLGQAFVRPVVVDKPLNLFISSESGRVYSLVMTPLDIPAHTVVLREKGAVRSAIAAPSPQKAGSYEAGILRLVSAMARNDPGTQIEVRHDVTDVALWRGFRFVREASFIERAQVGERYRLTNNTGASQVIAEQEFYKAGVIAVAVEILQLAPGQSTAVYIVRALER